MAELRRWAAGVEYQGTRYSGWQWQPDAPSLQRALQEALGKVADHAIELTAAGRTDAGVHALGQVVHFDSPAPRSAYAWLAGANSLLPPELSLRWVQPAAGDFHARFSAVSRRYRYVVLNSRGRGALLADRAAWEARPLDAAAMNEAAQTLVGEHDFSAFRGADCQSRTPMRHLHRIRVCRFREFVVLDVQANAFLQHMVRNITGTLLAVGRGEQPVGWVGELLRGRERARAGVTAPPGGLYFVGPCYPEALGLPEPPEPWFPGALP
ncbi:MAG TPA: tRNA pseudouridine(38-40) synthase TruA [Candidatus Binatia bacterium]|nr:tRNA pseudouridine(38-40) synthase TruA [Candidatus Binatia bacterium]